jgi:WhiB family transcriptional regulator, redox-sensing transcriptional regulator
MSSSQLSADLYEHPEYTEDFEYSDDFEYSASRWETTPIASMRLRRWDFESWRNDAACQALGVDFFFPVGDSPQSLEDVNGAKTVCQSCSVQDNCLEFALATGQRFGIWGGTSENERLRIRRHRRKSMKESLLVQRRRSRPDHAEQLSRNG